MLVNPHYVVARVVYFQLFARSRQVDVNGLRRFVLRLPFSIKMTEMRVGQFNVLLLISEIFINQKKIDMLVL